MTQFSPDRILLLATKTDLTRESTAVLHSILSILLMNKVCGLDDVQPFMF